MIPVGSFDSRTGRNSLLHYAVNKAQGFDSGWFTVEWIWRRMKWSPRALTDFWGTNTENMKIRLLKSLSSWAVCAEIYRSFKKCIPLVIRSWKAPQHLLDIFLSIPMQVTPLRKLEGSKNNKHDLFKINQDAQITFCQSLGKGSSGSTQSRKRRPCLANWSRLEIDKCGLLELTGAGQLEKAKHKWLCYEYASLSLTKF